MTTAPAEGNADNAASSTAEPTDRDEKTEAAQTGAENIASVKPIDPNAYLFKASKPTDESRNELIGQWTMTEARKDFNDDVIQFPIDILSVDDSGAVTVIWGINQIVGKWNESIKALCVYDNQIYLLRNGVLSGANDVYSGIATRDDSEQRSSEMPLIGSWVMTELHKDQSNDVIQYAVNIIMVDAAGNVTLDWSDLGRITAQWDEQKQALTVLDDQVYLLHDGILGGGNKTISGVALRY